MEKLTALTCPQCQAPVRNKTRCEYCGSVFELDDNSYESSTDNIVIGYAALKNNSVYAPNNGPHNTGYGGSVLPISEGPYNQRDFEEIWNRHSLMADDGTANVIEQGVDDETWELEFDQYRQSYAGRIDELQQQMDAIKRKIGEAMIASPLTNAINAFKRILNNAA